VTGVQTCALPISVSSSPIILEPEVRSIEEDIIVVLKFTALIVSAVISLAVTLVVIDNELREASEPLTMSFFQFGIYFNYGWLLISKSTPLTGL
jgi:hypothetical protein